MASNAERGSEAKGADRRTVANHSSTSMAPRAVAATVCWARMSSGLAGTLQPLDLAREHPLHGDGRVDEVCPVLREQDALGDFADLVAGAAHPLQAAGHRGRRLDLHHQVHGTHVDAELEGGRGHDAAQPPGFQVVLDQGALVLGHGAVVGAGQHGIGAGGAPGLGHHVGRCGGGRGLRGGAAGRHAHAAGRHWTRHGIRHGIRHGVEVRGAGAKVRPAAAGCQELAFGVDLVEPGGQPFGEAAGVRKHDGGLVGEHQVHDLFLHMRPDGGLRLQPGGRTGVEGPGGALEIGHVLHRDGDGQVPVLP